MNIRICAAIATAILPLSLLIAVPSAATLASPESPASGAPSAEQCGVPQLAYAEPISGDLTKDGVEVTPTATGWGGYIPIVMVHGWTGTSVHDDSRAGAFSGLINLYADPSIQIDIPRSLIGQLQGIPGAAVYTFDYHQESGDGSPIRTSVPHWVKRWIACTRRPDRKSS